MQQFLDSITTYPWLFAAFIILARITDVSIGTIRIIMVVRSYRLLAACLGFCEVFIWITAVSGVLTNITILNILAYCIGFASGNMVGVMIDQKMGIGRQLAIIISRGRVHSVAFALRLAGYVVTEIPAYGREGEVALCLTVISRRKTQEVIRIARTVDENAFISVNDVRHSSNASMIRPPIQLTGWRAVLKKK